MNDVTPELISIYADGAASLEEAARVEAAVAADPAVAAMLEEYENLAALFCPSVEEEAREATEMASSGLNQALYALGVTTPLKGFSPIKLEAAPSRPWGRWVAATAAVALLAIGMRQMLYRPEVVVTDFARQMVDAHGRVLKTERLKSISMRAGDVLHAKAGERISCRLPGGTMVVLFAGGRIRLGDPRDHEIFELDDGTALCTVSVRTGRKFVHAAGYEISADRAHFGIRIREPGVRSAGVAMAATPDAEVTVAVSRGSLQIGRDGKNETVRANYRLVLRSGVPAQRSYVWQDPLYVHLMRNFRLFDREILPGFFDTAGVTSIPLHDWRKAEDGSRRLVLGRVRGYVPYHLVLYARASKPTALAVTRITPDPDHVGVARTATVLTAPVGTDWTVVSVAQKAFEDPSNQGKNRKIHVSRSRLKRLELRAANGDTTFELKASLWAVRPPVDLSEVIK